MTARRILAGLALLFAACSTAACAQVVSGTGTAASDVQSGGGIGTPSPSGDSSPSPSESSSSSASSSEPTSTPSGTGSSDSAAPSPVCQALDKSAVETAFGTGVTFGRSSSSGCQLKADDGQSMIVAVFDYLKLSEYKKPGSTDLKVAGHPAVKTSTTIIYVARGSDPNTAGLIAAYYAGLRDGGDAIATKVLEMVVPKFQR